jgi:large subunit ribosomal protein L23
MGLFSKKAAVAAKTTEVVEKKTAKKTITAKTKAVKKALVVTGASDTSWVIIKPRITEKAALLGDKNIYVFEVARRATKADVKQAIATQFKVTPTKINIVNRTHRTTKSRARNRTITVSGAKKAHVYLKKGDTINLV